MPKVMEFDVRQIAAAQELREIVCYTLGRHWRTISLGDNKAVIVVGLSRKDGKRPLLVLHFFLLNEILVSLVCNRQSSPLRFCRGHFLNDRSLGRKTVRELWSSTL